MKINLADEVEQVTMAVGKNGLAFDVDDASITGDRDAAAFADRRRFVAINPQRKRSKARRRNSDDLCISLEILLLARR
jgi:hypothetical protein